MRWLKWLKSFSHVWPPQEVAATVHSVWQLLCTTLKVPCDDFWFFHSFIHPSIFLTVCPLKGQQSAGANPSFQWARGGVQLASDTETDNHLHSQLWENKLKKNLSKMHWPSKKQGHTLIFCCLQLWLWHLFTVALFEWVPAVSQHLFLSELH